MFRLDRACRNVPNSQTCARFLLDSACFCVFPTFSSFHGVFADNLHCKMVLESCIPRCFVEFSCPAAP